MRIHHLPPQVMGRIAIGQWFTPPEYMVLDIRHDDHARNERLTSAVIGNSPPPAAGEERVA